MRRRTACSTQVLWATYITSEGKLAGGGDTSHTHNETENRDEVWWNSTKSYNNNEKAVPGTALLGSQPSQPAATEVASQRHMTGR